MQTNMPENRRLFYMDAEHARAVVAINHSRAEFIKETIDALELLLK
jgi:hypothetical protein